MNDVAPPRRRSRIVLSIRALMLLVLAFGSGLGWIAYRARVQQQAVQRLRASGTVIINYDWEYPKPTEPRGPRWLRTTLGVDFFETVTSLTFTAPHVEESTLADVGRLTGLKDLRLINEDRSPKPQVEMSHLSSLTRLERLFLVSFQGEMDLAFLDGKLNVRTLEFSNFEITDENLSHLEKLTALEELSFDGRSVTDAGFAHLAPLHRMVRLTASGAKITERGLEALREMHDLKQLDISDYRPASPTDQLRLTSIEPLVGREKLDFLHLGKNPINDDGLKGIERLKSLRYLSSQSENIGDEGLRRIAGMPELGAVALGGKGITEAGLEALVKAPRLSNISIFNSSIPSLRSCESRMKKIASLHISKSPLTDQGIRPLKDGARLRRLGLVDTSVTDAGLDAISGLVTLVDLNLRGPNFTDAGLNSLRNLKNLDRLSLRRTKITVKGLANLKSMNRLRNLDLDETSLTDEMIDRIPSLPSLQFLTLRGTKVTSEGVNRLKKHLGPKVLVVTGPAIPSPD